MAKLYEGGVEIATGFKRKSNQPLLDDSVVEYVSDLVTLDNQYEGMRSYVIATQSTWELHTVGWENTKQNGSGTNPGVPFTGFTGQAYAIWTGTGLIYDVVFPNYYINDVFFPAGTTQITLDASDPTNPRQDIIGVDATGAIKVTGTPAIDPIAPTIDTTTQLFITSVLINAGATIPANTSLENVYLENVEWVATSNLSAVNLASTNTPFAGSVCIEATNQVANQFIKFTTPVKQSIDAWDILTFKIFLVAVPSPSLGFNLRFRNNDFPESLTLNIIKYGLLLNKIGEWQQIVVPIADFKLRNQYDMLDLFLYGTGAFHYKIDNIQLSKGTAIASPLQDAITRIYTDDDVIIADNPNQQIYLRGVNGIKVKKYGENGINIGPEDAPIIEDLPETQIINLGEIGNTPVEDGWQSMSTLTVQEQDIGYRIVKTLVFGVEADYIFTGVGGVYPKAIPNEAVASDFYPFDQKSFDSSINNFGKIKLTDNNGTVFNSLETARNYIEQFTNTLKTRESFEDGVYRFTVGKNSPFKSGAPAFCSNATTPSGANLKWEDPDGLFTRIIGANNFVGNTQNNVFGGLSVYLGDNAFNYSTGNNIFNSGETHANANSFCYMSGDNLFTKTVSISDNCFQYCTGNNEFKLNIYYSLGMFNNSSPSQRNIFGDIVGFGYESIGAFENYTGEAYLLGVIGTSETQTFGNDFFKNGANAVIRTKYSNLINNAGGLDGDLQRAITNGAKVIRDDQEGTGGAVELKEIIYAVTLTEIGATDWDDDVEDKLQAYNLANRAPADSGVVYTYVVDDEETVVNPNGLVLTTEGTSGEATLVGKTLNIPQYSGGDMYLALTQTVSGLKTFLSGMFGLRNVANTFTSFFTNANTASRTYTLQDKSYTIADNADLIEEKILGTALYNATLTGTVNLDLSAFSDYYGILTGNTTITVSNTPASGKSIVKNITLKTTATETLTLPVGWIIVGTFKNDTTENVLTIKFTNFPTVGAKVHCYIN